MMCILRTYGRELYAMEDLEKAACSRGPASKRWYLSSRRGGSGNSRQRPGVSVDPDIITTPILACRYLDRLLIWVSG